MLAFSSVCINFHNESNLSLVLDESSIFIDHGILNIPPPREIGPGETGKWGSTCDEFLSDVVGHCVYHYRHELYGDKGSVELRWSNLVEGPNAYYISVDGGQFECTHEGGDGGNAMVNFHFKNRQERGINFSLSEWSLQASI